MSKLTTLLVAGAVYALVLAALSLAASRSTVWTATLNSRQEVPKQVVKDTAAHGSFTGTLRGSKLKWKLTFAKLTGPAVPTAPRLRPDSHLSTTGRSGPATP